MDVFRSRGQLVDQTNETLTKLTELFRDDRMTNVYLEMELSKVDQGEEEEPKSFLIIGIAGIAAGRWRRSRNEFIEGMSQAFAR